MRTDAPIEDKTRYNRLIAKMEFTDLGKLRVQNVRMSTSSEMKREEG